MSHHSVKWHEVVSPQTEVVWQETNFLGQQLLALEQVVLLANQQAEEQLQRELSVMAETVGPVPHKGENYAVPCRKQRAAKKEKGPPRVPLHERCIKVSWETNFIWRNIQWPNREHLALRVRYRDCDVQPSGEDARVDEAKVEFREVCIGGSGPCWRRLFPDFERPERTTLSEFADMCENHHSVRNNDQNTRFWVKIVRMEDGDYHLEQVWTELTMRGRNVGWLRMDMSGGRVPADPTWKAELRTQPPDSPLLPISDVRAWCDTLPGERLIGGRGMETGVKGALASLKGTIHADAVMQEMVNPIMDRLDKEKQLGYYDVGPELASLLQSEGLDVTHQGTAAHSHGAHKTVENHLYNTVYPGFMQHDTVAVFFTKQQKFDRLRKRHPNFRSLHNVVLDAKDWGRYGPCSLPPILDETAILLWDVGQHINPMVVAALLDRYPSVQRVYIGAVFAPESKDHLASIYPNYYELKYVDGQVIYSMEGTENGAYEQPKESSWLLECRNVTVKFPTHEFHYQLEPLNSLLTHHLVVASRGVTAFPRNTWTCTVPDLMRIPEPWALPFRTDPLLGDQLVPREMYHAVLTYYTGLSTSKRKVEDIVLKIRNLRNSPQYRHIRPDTWRRLLYSVACVAEVDNEAPSMNSYNLRLWACILRFFYRKLQELSMPNWKDLGFTLAEKLINFILPHWVGVPVQLLSLAHNLAVADDWTDLGWALAKAMVIPLLSPAFIASVSLLGLGTYLARWAVARNDALKRRVLEEVHCSKYSLVFYAKDKVFRASPNANIFATVETRPKDDLANLIVHRCPLCGHASRGHCKRCRTCPLHDVTWPDWHRKFPCCASVEANARARAEYAHNLELDAELRLMQERLRELRRPTVEEVPDEGEPTVASASEESPQPPTTSDANSSDGVSTDIDEAVAAAERGDEGPVPEQPEQTDVFLPELSMDDLAAQVQPNPVTPVNADPHTSCNCIHHQGGTNQPGLKWVTCPANHGVWSSGDGSDCHICNPLPRIKFGGKEATVAKHRYIHELAGVPINRTVNGDHKNFRVAADYVLAPPGPTPHTCALLAMSAATGHSADDLWRTICLVLPADACSAIVDDHGLDERAFEAVHCALGATANLKGVPRGVPKSCGMVSKRVHNYRWSLLPTGEPHWAYEDSESPALKTLDSTGKTASNKLVQDFLKKASKFTSSHGEKLQLSWEPYRSNKASCKELIREFKTGVFGTIKRLEGHSFENDFTKKMDAVHEHSKPREVQLCKLSGLAGCGKTAPLRELLRQQGSNWDGKGLWMLSVARQLIHHDWKQALSMKKGAYALNTFELALTRNASILIIDELSLMPPGYVDLMLILKPTISHVILLGDNCQSRFNNPHNDTVLNELQNEADRFFGAGSEYWFWTHRSPQCIADILEIPTTSPVKGEIVNHTSIDHRYPIIGATNGEVSVYNSLGGVARNIGGHQGGTLHTAQFVVTSTVLTKTSKEDIYSAISRVTHKLILVLSAEAGFYKLLQQNQFMHALVFRTGKYNFKQHFDSNLKHARLVEKSPQEILRLRQLRASSTPAPTRANGKSTEVIKRANGKSTFDSAYLDRAPPNLSVLLHHLPDIREAEAEALDRKVLELRSRTRMPRADPQYVLEQALAALKHREARELVNHLGMSELFLERETDGPSTDALFPHQKPGDPVLFRETIRKRLDRGSFEQNEIDFRDQDWKAELLFRNFAEIAELPADPMPFDPALFQQCIFENEFNKLTKKTKATLLNNVKRSDPDWKLNLVDHFIKSQLKAKLETLGADGKAGQTLATCQDAVVLLFGPMVRYTRKLVLNRLPENIFCNCEKTNADLSAWSRKYVDDTKESTTSDYTGFDSTQKGDSLGLELRIMLHCGLHLAWLDLMSQFLDVAQTLPEMYRWWKLHIVSTVVGVKDTGRDTGEPGTYDFNTYFNLALIQLMYRPPRGTPIAVGGDDMAANLHLRLTPLWLRVRDKFLIVAKVEYTLAPEFCGYKLSQHGSFRNPRLLMLKTLWHLQKGDQLAVDLSYAGECLSAYELGDHLYDRCTWDELCCQGWLLEYYHQRYGWAQRIFGSVDNGTLVEELTRLGPKIELARIDEMNLGRRAAATARSVARQQIVLEKAIKKNIDFFL